MLLSSIPSTLSSLRELQELYLYGNELTGTIPTQLSTLRNLKTLLLYKNQFTGPITYLVNSTLQTKLQTIDVSQNMLTGSIPGEIFKVKSLTTFAAAVNCLQGMLPLDLCNSANLTTLVLDGLSTASTCVDHIFGAFSRHSLYALKGDIVEGGVPACLYSLPSLATLHLSGNGITGSIPSKLALHPVLQDLSLVRMVCILTADLLCLLCALLFYN